ncbi:MAG: hypothetical protein ABIE23_03880 [archaeon]
MITLFLLVFVVALVIGNSLLFFTGSRDSTHAGSDLGRLKERIGEGIPESSEGVGEIEVNARLKAANKKTEMAHSRMNELEKKVKVLALEVTKTNEMLKMKGVKKGSIELNDRVDRLDHFRHNTKIEIAAVKDLLDDLRKTLPLMKKPRKSRKELIKLNKETKELEKRIHDIVFHKAK